MTTALINNGAIQEGLGGPDAWVGDWILCEGFGFLGLQVSWTADANTDGLVLLQGINDPNRADANNLMTFDTDDLGWWVNGELGVAAADWPTTSTGTAFLGVKNPMKAMRLIYFRNAGDAFFSVYHWKRAS